MRVQCAQLAAVLMLALTLVSAREGPRVAPAADPFPPTSQGVEDLLRRVGERVAEFYSRVQNVLCIEISTVQPIDFNSSPQGFARTVESELRVERPGGAAGEATIVRKVRKVNGRVPRASDARSRAGCTDPSPLSPEPLAFLLPAQRAEYRFKIARRTTEKNRTSVVVDFTSADLKSSPRLIEDPSGHEDCFDWSGHLAERGHIWIDASSYDVLRVERALTGPVDVTVPALIERRYHLPAWIVLDRDDLAIRYRTVAFSEPAEELLLPESIDSLTVIRGGLESARRRQTYSNYQRFITGGKVVK